MRTIALVLLSVLLSACAATPVKMTIPFDEKAFAFSLQQGTGVIYGQAFLKTQGGDVKLGAGNQVELVPLTPYIRERLAKGTIAGQNIEPRDPRVKAYARTTVADAGGNFEFTDIPAGEYVLYCVIQWMAPSAYSMTGVMATGGTAYATVKVAEGQRVKVILTR